MYDVILFGGTTEGRELAGFLSVNKVPALVCVATEYGGKLLDCCSPVQIQSDRLCRSDIAALLSAERPRIVIDATHPYARQISENLQYACQQNSLHYARVLRDRIESDASMNFTDIDSLIAWLNQTEGIIFAATGAKEAHALTRITNFSDRVVLRMLPSPEGIASCLELGYSMKRLICMQGPFTEALNTAMFREVNAKILVTKESGKNGGFFEKLSAAKACGMTTAILDRPPEKNGYTLNEVKAFIQEVLL
jgi:precorrin-6x reductase